MNFTNLPKLSSNVIFSKTNWNVRTAAIVASSTLVGTAFIYLGKIWYSYGFFKRRGIKTPKYKFIWGNFDEIEENNYSETLMKWTKELGSIYGYFEGHTPILVTSDLEIIQEVFIKDYFTHFSGRKLLPILANDEDDIVNIAFSSKNRWKRMRTIINPTFSPAKLRELLPILKLCTDRLLLTIEKNVDKELDLTELSTRMTMDAVMNSLFGIEVDIQNNPDNIYLEKMQLLVNQASELPAFLKALILFPEIKPVLIGFSLRATKVAFKLGLLAGQPFFWLMNKVGEIINERKNNLKEKTRRDYMHILLEALSDETDHNADKSSDISLVQKKLSTEEIKTNLVGFLGAGTETTSTTLTSCIQVLALMQEEQTRLREEIEQHIDSADEIDYEALNKCEYMELFLKEVLRMYSLGNTFLNRRCTKATTVKGIHIPEDLTIAIDGMSLHFNPEYWGSVDPFEFYPERFLDPSINKQAYMPFGIGPRTCIGMKFALIQIKLALVKMLKSYQILPGPHTATIKEFTQSFKEALVVRKTSEPVRVVFKAI